MSAASLDVALRGIAIAIAIAGVVDPGITIDRAAAAPLVVVNLTSRDNADIRERVSAGGEAVMRTAERHRVPCAPPDRCLVIADGSVHATMPRDLTAPALAIDRTRDSNVEVRSVEIAATHAAGASMAGVVLHGTQVAGQRTSVHIREGAATLGTAEHVWQGDGTVRVDVPWWPAGAGARTLRVEASPGGGEAATFDNIVDVAVDVGAGQIPVLVFDARPSWASTFVRRALEDDGRFAVEYRTRLAPAVTGGTPRARLEAELLDRVHLVIIGSPDALTKAEQSLIDRFVRLRGGTAIILPDRPPTKAEAALLPGDWAERLSAEPRAVGPLRSSELLQLAAAPPGSFVIAADGARPVIVEFPVGDGALIVSGAMDAWRHRDRRDERADFSPPGSAFDAFWRSLAAQAAAVSGPIRIDVESGPLLAGTRHRFTARARSMRPLDTVEASAVLQCRVPAGSDGSDMTRAVRLWPAGSARTWTGEFVVPSATGCALEVQIGDAIAISALAVSNVASPPAAIELEALTRDVVRVGGTVTTLEAVGGEIPGSAPGRIEARIYPLRSAWWILPFALCLSAEWWSRRRRGLP